MPNQSSGRAIIGILFVVLFVLHHDFWFWSDKRLVFGFLPIGLAYHALFSIAAACLWFTALKIAWPSDLEAWADTPEQNHDNAGDAQP